MNQNSHAPSILEAAPSAASNAPMGQCARCEHWAMLGGTILPAMPTCLAIGELNMPMPVVAVLMVAALEQGARGVCRNRSPLPEHPDAYRSRDLVHDRQ